MLLPCNSDHNFEHDMSRHRLISTVMIIDIATGSDVSSPLCIEQNGVKGESLTQKFTSLINVK